MRMLETHCEKFLALRSIDSQLNPDFEGEWGVNQFGSIFWLAVSMSKLGGVLERTWYSMSLYPGFFLRGQDLIPPGRSGYGWVGV